MKMTQEKNYEYLLALAEEYYQKAEEVIKNKPYHINIIEELHINENAHSRILAKLLMYQNDNKEYVFLKSLLEFIQQFNENFSNITITDPQISQEKDRIDLLVLDKEYALIFENKIYDAKDQEQQISRYIEKVKKKNYKDECIYIVYLTSFYKDPDLDTWGTSKKKNTFSSRYCNLSYKSNILPWLNIIKDTLPNLQNEMEDSKKHSELRSAMEQYIGYLNILFNYNTMEDDLKNFFKNELKWNLKQSVDSLEKIQKFEEGHLVYIRNVIQEQINIWLNDHKDIKPFEDPRPEVNPLVINLHIKDSTYWLYIQIDESCKSIRCCFEIEKREQLLIRKRAPIINTIKEKFANFEDYKFYSEWNLSDEEALSSALEIFLKIKEEAQEQ